MDRAARPAGLASEVIATLFASMGLWQIFAIASYFSSVSSGLVAAGTYVVFGGFAAVRSFVLRRVLASAGAAEPASRQAARAEGERRSGRVIVIDLLPSEYSRT